MASTAVATPSRCMPLLGRLVTGPPLLSVLLHLVAKSLSFTAGSRWTAVRKGNIRSQEACLTWENVHRRSSRDEISAVSTDILDLPVPACRLSDTASQVSDMIRQQL